MGRNPRAGGVKRLQVPLLVAPISALMSPTDFIIAAAMLAQPPAASAPVREVKPADAAAASSPVRPSLGPIRRVDPNAEAGPLRDNLEAVDAGTEDVGALGTSFREPAHDSRLPTGFQRVYRVPGDEGKLMRGNGALFAVFPESVYRRSARGTAPIAPPGTVFHIGMPGDLHLSPAPQAQRVLVPGQIDGRVGVRVGPENYFGVTRIDSRVDGRHPTPADAAIGASLGERVRGQSPVPEGSPPPPPAPGVDASPLASPGPYAHLGFGPPRVQRD